MTDIQRRAQAHIDSFSPIDFVHSRPEVEDTYRTAYEHGARDQHKIDIRKACEAVCSFCQDKEQCYESSWDTIENMRLAVSCEKIDKLVEAMEEQI